MESINSIKMNEIIENSEDLYKSFSDETLNEELQKSLEDIKAGRVISFSEFKEKLKKRYNIYFF